MDIKQLTPEQRAELFAQVKEQQAAEKKQRDDQIAAYKEIVDAVVEDSFPELTALAAQLKIIKKTIRERFATVIELKGELYEIKDGQQTHQFINTAGTRRIRIGYNVLDNYDDTVEAGIAIVKEYVQGLARDADSQQLVDMILDLLAKDGKGTLKASKVLRLRKYADRSGNDRFIEGVKIIMDAYKPIESKHFIKAEYKADNGAWLPIPNGLTEA